MQSMQAHRKDTIMLINNKLLNRCIKMKFKRYYLDPLYGPLDFDQHQLQLFQTKALTRLRDISLSVVPPIATPSGMITSRFEHSVGVGYLAKKLLDRGDLDHIGNNLYLAALFHDAGSPPFSHATELVLEDLTGKNHEEFVEKVLHDDDVQQAMKPFDVDTDIIYHLITGDLQPWSDLMNGTIDLDNIDNSLRWGMGVGIFQSKFYEPEEVIKAYEIRGDVLGINHDYMANIHKWELCRRLVYDVVYSDLNLGPGSVLFRALEFACKAGDLDLSFYNLTESQALYFLENRCNAKTQKLISDMRRWNFYYKAGEITQEVKASEKMLMFCNDWKQRQKIADIVAESLRIPAEDVTVYAGKDRGFKKIHLPIFKGKDVIDEHRPIQKEAWRVRVYVDPTHIKAAEEVQSVLESILA